VRLGFPFEGIACCGSTVRVATNGSSSPGVRLNFEDIPSIGGPYGLSPPSSLFGLGLNRGSALRSRDRHLDPRGRTASDQPSMSFGAAPEYGRSSQSPTRAEHPSRPQRMQAPSVRHRHSQGLTDDGGRPTRLFSVLPKEVVTVCRHPLHARRPTEVSLRTSCRVVRWAPSLAQREDRRIRSKFSDTFLGVRCLSTKSVTRIVSAPTCLTGAIRSQGFSPSQRFESPRDLVALFHATSVHRLLGLQSFSHPASRSAFRRPMLSCRPGLGTLRTEVLPIHEETATTEPCSG